MACSIATADDMPDPPDFTIRVEPDTVRVRTNAQQRSQFDMLVRITNHGPGMLFMPDCGHELQRAQPNGSWLRVHTVVCRTGDPPFAVDAGEGFGYAIRINAPADSSPWQRASIVGRYRTLSYISAEFRPNGVWGRPIAHDLRISSEFAIREEVP
jgi:hypothetical protein